MFSLLDLRFALCSLDFLRITRAKDHRLFSLNYPQISEVGKVDHVVISHVTKLEDIFFSFICTTNCFIYRYPPLPPSLFMGSTLKRFLPLFIFAWRWLSAWEFHHYSRSFPALGITLDKYPTIQNVGGKNQILVMIYFECFHRGFLCFYMFSH